MELFDMKARAEEELRGSSLGWTIVRATAFMETWLALIGEPLRSTGRTRVFGRARNPINFVSARDVAGVVVDAVVGPQHRRTVIEVGGPEDLSLLDIAERFKAATGAGGKVSHIPRPAMRMMSVLMRPFNPVLALHAASGVVMDTRSMTFDALASKTALTRRGETRISEVIRRLYVEVPVAAAHQTA